MIFSHYTPRKQSFSHLIIALIISSFSVSCGTTTPVIDRNDPAENQIVDEEVRKFSDAGIIHIESNFYNHNFKGILKAYNNGDRLAKMQLNNSLTEAEIKELLNPDQIEWLLQQLEQVDKVPYTPLMASKKVVLEDLTIKKDRNYGQSNQRLKELDKDRMIISTPVFTRNREYAFVDVSKGRLNGMYTTINLYQKSGDKFVFYKTLFGYME
ncbi:hypothetical protein FK178_11405 [Antarcticibacterium arcticum]|uniref:Uncharacterized protein n=1 Tax=Antarcticibacterium arcticum TaxID=2585771 RepID=A0A5B8YK97_9FLAO|nr:hypothetical protein [Antarcticibacterium arcticum]QED38282.1 hypothetical protein FK178_11405 [Antarcticibacterium arcticum]